MLTNADITIYNSFLAPESRMRVWHRTMIKGVWFHVDNKVSLTDGGLASADAYKVRIPVHADFGGSQYVPPDEYVGAGDTWTLKNDDYIVKGIGPDIEKPADLQKESRTAFKVTSWSDNRHGGLKHWRVGGV
uniref:DUF6751 family protein n=1 Tax=Enterocloster clostridioformis TaxID=1531 RepID=UPI0026EA792F|nr:DUF6751 family protein [Enterocloster clostridioformis]